MLFQAFGQQPTVLSAWHSKSSPTGLFAQLIQNNMKANFTPLVIPKRASVQ